MTDYFWLVNSIVWFGIAAMAGISYLVISKRDKQNKKIQAKNKQIEDHRLNLSEKTLPKGFSTESQDGKQEDKI